MAQEIITLENLAAEIAKLRGELATWKALAIKQDRLSTAQMLAVNSGATAGKIAQIATNTSDIAALQQIASSAFRVVKVAQLPASGEPYIMYLVPQTDGETLNYCNEYLWIDNAWELVGTTGAMANNGELQIIVNGVTVGTFTANQATDSTASITVPTDTSQLTNGAGYVDATALATALASKQDSLSLTQLAAVNSGITAADVAQIGANTTAIAGKQDALTTSQLAAVNSGITSADVTQIGTNTGNIATNSAAIVSLQGSKQNTLSAAQLLAVNSGITSSLVTQIGTNQSDITTLNTALGQSLTPSADNTYSLGGASFRYANVYAVTFTGDLTGTASKAIADEDGNSIKTGYVNVAGNQTVTGNKSFTGSNTFNNILPNATSTYSLGSSSYQWASVYAQTYYGYTMYFESMSERVIRFQTNGSNNYKNFDTYIGTTYTQYDNTVAMHRSVGRRGDTTEGATINDVDTSFSFFKAHINYKAFDLVDAVTATNNGTENSLKPITTSVTDLGTPSNQWKSVYAQTYYYNGTAWGLDKANEWSAENTFTAANLFRKRSFTLGDNSSQIVRMEYKDTNNARWGILAFVHNTDNSVYCDLGVNCLKNDGQTELSKVIRLLVKPDNSAEYKPLNDKAIDLGTSTNKWKTLNGVNPGALSLPDKSRAISIDTTNFVYGSDFTFTPTVSGWLFVSVTNCTKASLKTGVGEYYFNQSSGIFRDTIPVIAGEQVTLLLFSTATSAPTIILFPCLGNV